MMDSLLDVLALPNLLTRSLRKSTIRLLSYLQSDIQQGSTYCFWLWARRCQPCQQSSGKDQGKRVAGDGAFQFDSSIDRSAFLVKAFRTASYFTSKTTQSRGRCDI